MQVDAPLSVAENKPEYSVHKLLARVNLLLRKMENVEDFVAPYQADRWLAAVNETEDAPVAQELVAFRVNVQRRPAAPQEPREMPTLTPEQLAALRSGGNGGRAQPATACHQVAVRGRRSSGWPRATSVPTSTSAVKPRNPIVRTEKSAQPWNTSTRVFSSGSNPYFSPSTRRSPRPATASKASTGRNRR